MKHNIIFCHGRSGGNLLELKLNQVEGVKRLGEVFRNHGYFHRVQNNKYPDTRYLKDLPLHDINNIFKKIEEIESNTVEHFIYRMHPRHLTLYPDIDFLEFSKQFDKQIILYREGLINTLVSLYIAIDLHTWHYTNQHKVPSYDKYNFIISRRNTKRYHNIVRTYYNDIINKFGYDNIFYVRYEDLIQDDYDLQPLLDFLEIENKINTDCNIPTIHINPNDDNYKRVINYDEIKDIRLELDTERKLFKKIERKL